jgi:hypothetical protein
MLRKQRTTQPHGLKPVLTTLEEGLRDAIFAEPGAKRAFLNLVQHGYEANHLIVSLTLWARSPEVLYSYSARSELPGRDARRVLERLPLKLRAIADEVVGQGLCKELLDPKFLQRNQMIRENGGSEMGRCMELLPQTLRMCSRLLTRNLLIKSRFARHDKTLHEHRAEFTRIFCDSVKGTTRKDRVDSVVILFNVTSQHLSLGEHFEKRALTAQLRRLREKVQCPPGYKLRGIEHRDLAGRSLVRASPGASQ